MTHIVLVRHGQTAWNKEVRFRGQIDVPLDEFGLRQAEATGRYVAARWPVTAVYASPMGRAMQTAEAIAQVHDLTAEPLDALLDVHFGDWQGLSPAEVAERDPERCQAWYQAPHTVRFPGGESLDVVRQRLLAGLEEMVERHPDETIAFVGHAVVNRVLLCIVLGVGNENFWRLEQDTCAVNRFITVEDGGFRLLLMNDTSHLQGV